MWSISPYRENFYVRNAIERYGILSSMPLKYNADDRWTCTSKPSRQARTNRRTGRPLRRAVLNLTVRIYQPKKEALDGTYKLPPVTKAR